jgi:hypothetical protein
MIYSLETFVDLPAEPVKALVKSVSCRRAGSLHVPGVRPDRVQPEAPSQFGGLQYIRKILLVRVD